MFAAWTSQLDVAPLVSRAVALESDELEDAEHDDEPAPPLDHDLNQIDESWPPPDPMNEIDDLPAPPLPKKRKRATTFDDCIATGKPQSGPHRRRAVRRKLQIGAEGHTTPASVRSEVTAKAVPIAAPHFDTSTLPAAQGAYGGKTENADEKRGKTRKRSVAELIGLGFQLISWDGRYVAFNFSALPSLANNAAPEPHTPS